MFTGLVEELGTVIGLDRHVDSVVLTIAGDLVQGTAIGDSIAVNGVCLTATSASGKSFRADVMQQTLTVTTLGELKIGDRVNLERPVRLSDRLGGHLVQGHVDGIGKVVRREPGVEWERVTIELPAELAKYVVDKGSICLDGTSLTVAELSGTQVVVSLIPETLQRTTLGFRAVGDHVNIEVDVLAKYVERLMGAKA